MRANGAGTATHASPKMSAKSGTHPSMPSRACGIVVGATREHGKDLAQEVASMRDHRRRQERL